MAPIARRREMRLCILKTKYIRANRLNAIWGRGISGWTALELKRLAVALLRATEPSRDQAVWPCPHSCGQVLPPVTMRPQEWGRGTQECVRYNFRLQHHGRLHPILPGIAATLEWAGLGLTPFDA